MPDGPTQSLPRHADGTPPLGWFLCGLILLTACSPVPDSRESISAEGDTAEQTAEQAPEPCRDATVTWSYSGDDGPQHWAELSPCFALCEAGGAQSPVAIEPGEPVALPSLRFDYLDAPLRIGNTGHTVQLEHDFQSALDFGEMTFKLQQIHFHSPSEHTLRGREAAMEMHLVHGTKTGTLAVVGVLIEPGDDNAGLVSIWPHLPDTPGDMQDIPDATVQTAGLLPDSLRSHRYAGSLTTPPCNESVHWIVLDEAITLSQEKIDAFRALYDGNRRPVQPLGTRQVQSDP